MWKNTLRVDPKIGGACAGERWNLKTSLLIPDYAVTKMLKDSGWRKKRGLDAMKETPMQDPILATIPDRFETERLLIRVPQAGDGPDVNATVMDSLDTLQRWMTWARTPPSVAQSEANCRRARAQFELREAIALRLYLKGTSTVIGSSGFPRLDWSVPKFEMSYWIRSQYQGRGYATEAVRAIVAYAESHLCAKRVEISMDSRNTPSRRVVERCEFQFEGIQRCSKRDTDGNLCDMCWYGRVFT